MGDARDVLHDEVGPALGRGAGVEDLGDGRMIHQRQCLPLGLETRHHFARVHARLDQLDGHPAAHRLLLLGEPDLAHAAFADQLQQIIRVDFAFRRASTSSVVNSPMAGIGQKLSGLLMFGEQPFDLSAHIQHRCSVPARARERPCWFLIERSRQTAL